MRIQFDILTRFANPETASSDQVNYFPSLSTRKGAPTISQVQYDPSRTDCMYCRANSAVAAGCSV